MALWDCFEVLKSFNYVAESSNGAWLGNWPGLVTLKCWYPSKTQNGRPISDAAGIYYGENIYWDPSSVGKTKWTSDLLLSLYLDFPFFLFFFFFISVNYSVHRKSVIHKNTKTPLLKRGMFQTSTGETTPLKHGAMLTRQSDWDLIIDVKMWTNFWC